MLSEEPPDSHRSDRLVSLALEYGEAALTIDGLGADEIALISVVLAAQADIPRASPLFRDALRQCVLAEASRMDDAAQPAEATDPPSVVVAETDFGRVTMASAQPIDQETAAAVLEAVAGLRDGVRQARP